MIDLFSVTFEAEQVAKWLRDKRQELHLTQEEMAGRLHMSRQQVSRYENNRVDDTHALSNYIRRVAGVLGMDERDVFTEIVGDGSIKIASNDFTEQDAEGEEDTTFNLKELQREYGSGDITPDQIIRKYFEIYGDRKERLAELIRSGKIEHMFRLIE